MSVSVPIQSRDFWVKVVEMLQQNWALIEPKGSKVTEQDRQNYLVKLARLRDRLARSLNVEECLAVDTEIRRHPAPDDTEGYTQLIVGEWSSPRHAYLYRADGTWSMLPEEEGTTRGRWRIAGNQFSSNADTEPSGSGAYTILLLTKDDFIFTDGDAVFYEERISE
jgi:hypothetical protein